jgi:hypothetical protein
MRFPSKPDAKGLENGFAGIIYGRQFRRHLKEVTK